MDFQKNRQFLRKIHQAMLHDAYNNPLDAAAAIISAEEESKDIISAKDEGGDPTSTAVATNFFIISMAYQIARHGCTKPIETGSLSPEQYAASATMLYCAAGIKAVLDWTKASPQEAQAVDEALSNFAREHQLGEYNFNGRNAADNVAAIEKAGQAPPPNPGRVNPPPSARHALDIIAARTAQMLKDYAAMARAKDPLYFHDTHYDRYTTNLWAKSLGDAISKGPE